MTGGWFGGIEGRDKLFFRFQAGEGEVMFLFPFLGGELFFF